MKKQLRTIIQSPVFKVVFKFTAVVKYLFFPFLFVQSQDIDVQNIIGNRTITATVETEHTIWVGTTRGIVCINKQNKKL